MEPISPQKIEASAPQSFPDFVIEAFNEVIKENYRNGRSEFQQDVVVSRIEKKGKCKRAQIFDNKWLDIELVFQQKG
jgi:hypothetical protein